MGEFAKFVDYKKDADTIINKLKSEVSILELRIATKDARINLFETVTKPSLTSLITLEQQKQESNTRQWLIKENALNYEIKAQSKKKWNFGLWGVVLGSLVGFFAAFSL